MADISSGAYAFFGALIGSGITLLLERKKLKESREQLLFKEKAEKVYQFAKDVGAAAYCFC